MNEMIHEDDPEMGILYDIQTYYDASYQPSIYDKFNLEFLNGIESHLKTNSKISRKQLDVLKNIHSRLALLALNEEVEE